MWVHLIYGNAWMHVWILIIFIHVAAYGTENVRWEYWRWLSIIVFGSRAEAWFCVALWRRVGDIRATCLIIDKKGFFLRRFGASKLWGPEATTSSASRLTQHCWVDWWKIQKGATNVTRNLLEKRGSAELTSGSTQSNSLVATAYMIQKIEWSIQQQQKNGEHGRKTAAIRKQQFQN